MVDTTNFHPQTRPAFASPDAHVVERFSKMENGDLLYQFTVSDPSMWAESWSGEYVWRQSDDRIYEYACHEGNYSMAGILRGARLLEAERMQQEGLQKESGGD